MKKYIRFFRNKEDGVPINSFQVCKNGNKIVGCISDDATCIKELIDGWMDSYSNGKVDFVWLPS
jgi:hypothetical protein